MKCLEWSRNPNLKSISSNFQLDFFIKNTFLTKADFLSKKCSLIKILNRNVSFSHKECSSMNEESQKFEKLNFN